MAHGQAVQPVPSLDLTRFTGTWYEIARLPNKAEKKCVGNALTLYALEDKDNHFSMVDSCSLKDDTPQIRNDSGRRPGKATDGRLQTTFLLFFHHRRWVLALDPNYGWALVGSPNHKNLWLYSRTLTLDPAVLSDLRSRAVVQGFNVDKVVVTPQSDRMRLRGQLRPGASVEGGAAR